MENTAADADGQLSDDHPATRYFACSTPSFKSPS